jgi:hypothetical protein
MRTRLRHRLLPRILWTGGIAAVVAIAGALMLHGSAGTRHATTAQLPVATTTTATRAARRVVPLRPAVSNVVLKFVKSAVMRSHATQASLLEGWRLTGPKLKEGTTLREWLAGTSSVVPFPDGAIAPHVQVDSADAKDALLELALYPKGSTTVSAGVFMIGLHRYGAGSTARWLVDYWAPHGASSMPAAGG